MIPALAGYSTRVKLTGASSLATLFGGEQLNAQSRSLRHRYCVRNRRYTRLAEQATIRIASGAAPQRHLKRIRRTVSPLPSWMAPLHCQGKGGKSYGWPLCPLVVHGRNKADDWLEVQADAPQELAERVVRLARSKTAKRTNP